MSRADAFDRQPVDAQASRLYASDVQLNRIDAAMLILFIVLIGGGMSLAFGLGLGERSIKLVPAICFAGIAVWIGLGVLLSALLAGRPIRWYHVAFWACETAGVGMTVGAAFVHDQTDWLLLVLSGCIVFLCGTLFLARHPNRPDPDTSPTTA